MNRETPTHILICDIDGVIADSTERMQAAGPEPSRSDKAAYSKWLMRLMSKPGLMNDEPILPTVEMIKALERSGWQVIYLTSRAERWRDTTIAWLREVAGLDAYAPLLMRGEGDWRSSAEFKADAIVKVMEKWEDSFSGFGEVAEDWIVVWDDDCEDQLGKICLEMGVTFMKPFSTVELAQTGRVIANREEE